MSRILTSITPTITNNLKISNASRMLEAAGSNSQEALDLANTIADLERQLELKKERLEQVKQGEDLKVLASQHEAAENTLNGFLGDNTNLVSMRDTFYAELDDTLIRLAIAAKGDMKDIEYSDLVYGALKATLNKISPLYADVHIDYDESKKSVVIDLNGKSADLALDPINLLCKAFGTNQDAVIQNNTIQLPHDFSENLIDTISYLDVYKSNDATPTLKSFNENQLSSRKNVLEKWAESNHQKKLEEIGVDAPKGNINMEALIAHSKGQGQSPAS